MNFLICLIPDSSFLLLFCSASLPSLYAGCFSKHHSVLDHTWRYKALSHTPWLFRITIEKTIRIALMSADPFPVCLVVFSGTSVSDLEGYCAIYVNFREWVPSGLSTLTFGGGWMPCLLHSPLRTVTLVSLIGHSTGWVSSNVRIASSERNFPLL